MKKLSLSKKKNRLNPLATVLLVVLVLYALSFFLLLYWGLISSFKSDDIQFSYPGGAGFSWPNPFTTEYYDFIIFGNEDAIYHLNNEVGKEIYIEEMIHNSIVYAIGSAFFQTLVPCLTAYACARFNFKFTKIYYYIVIITMIIPIVGSTASEILLAQNLHIYGELWGMWIMKANFLGLYFLIFLETFKNLPMTYTEAAKIDGANNFSILFKIILPLVRNTFFTIFLLNFVTYWNDYTTPILYLKNRPTIFYAISQAAFGTSDNAIATTPGLLSLSIIGIIPTVVLFICFNKKLLGNISVGGIK